MIKITIQSIIFSLFLLLAAGLSAQSIQDSPEITSLYTKGKRLLRQGDFYEAGQVFSELEGRFPNSKNLDLFVFHRAKAKYYFAEYDEAVAGFSFFIKRFTNSAYQAEGHFFLANTLYLKSDIDRAVKTYITAYKLSQSNSLDQLIESSLLAAFKNASSLSLTDADLEKLSQEKKCKLIKPLSQIYIDRGEIAKAEQILAACGQTLSENDRDQINNNNTNKQLEIAMVLPLSGELQSYGEDIYNGAVIAADLYRKESGKQLKIVPYDTKGDPIEAAQIIAQLSTSQTTDAVVGPLTSEEASVASAILNCGSLPMIIPAATEAGLTRLSESSFQLSPNIELESISLAEYAYNQLNADSVVIISSSITDHIRMTRAFENQFKRLGGTVVAVQYYRSRDKDFGTYIRDIKSILLGHPSDSTYYITEDGDTLDFELLAAYVDCIFMPGVPKQLKQLIPQMHFYNLNGFYLGTDGWGDRTIVKLGENVTKGAVFASPFLEGKLSEEFMTLAAAYDSRYGKRPQRLSALGFDAVRLLIQATSTGVNRDVIIENLQKVKNYIGASGKISYGNFRENIEMPLYIIQNEKANTLESLNDDSIENNIGE